MKYKIDKKTIANMFLEDGIGGVSVATSSAPIAPVNLKNSKNPKNKMLLKDKYK